MTKNRLSVKQTVTSGFRAMCEPLPWCEVERLMDVLYDEYGIKPKIESQPDKINREIFNCCKPKKNKFNG
jgi:hypothetical protein